MFRSWCSCESGRLTLPLPAQPIPSEGEFLCSPPSPPPPLPQETRSSYTGRQWRLYSRHRHRPRYPGPTVSDLSCCTQAAQTRPLDVAASPEPGCGLGRPRLQPRGRGGGSGA